MMLAHGNLATHIKTIVSLKEVPGMNWSVSEIEDLTPFEKDAYITVIKQRLKEREAKNGR